MNLAIRILTLALAAAWLPAAAQDELDTKPATAAATAWLSLVDGGRYGESWDQSAALFRETVPKLQWETSVQGIRATLGGVSGRKLRSASYMRDLPNAPPGDYVILQYDTVFANRPQAVETITPMREKDGTWRVSGYFIR